MAKKKQEKAEKQLTKKEIALSSRHKKENMRLYIGLAILAAILLIVAAIGAYDTLVAKPSKPVAEVNGVVIKSSDYQDRVRYQRMVLDGILFNIQGQMNAMDNGDPSNDFMLQYYQQMASQFYQQRLGVDRQTLDDMIEQELSKQEAAELGLSVSDDEIREAIRSRMASQVGAITVPQATSFAVTAVAATATADTFTATPDPTPTALTVSLAATDTLESLLPAVEDMTPAPTPTYHILSDDEFSQEYEAYLKILSEQAEMNESEYQALIKAGLLRDKVAEHFADQVPPQAEQVNISHIQVNTQPEVDVVMLRLDSGEDFGLVATEVSSDTFTAQNGGDMGWILPGELASYFGQKMEDAAFGLEVGNYSQPITSTLGWQIIKVNERGLHPLDDRQLSAEQDAAYSLWLQAALAGDAVVDLWGPEMAPPETPQTQPF